MFRSLVKKIQEHSKNYYSKEDDQRSHVHNLRIDVFSADLVCVIFYERVGKICLTKFFLYFPLPVCNGAIAPAKPDTQNKPGKSGCCNGYQVSLACL